MTIKEPIDIVSICLYAYQNSVSTMYDVKMGDRPIFVLTSLEKQSLDPLFYSTAPTHSVTMAFQSESHSEK